MTILDAIVQLTNVMERRMKRPRAWGMLARARNCLKWAVEKEERPDSRDDDRQIVQANEEESSADTDAVEESPDPDTAGKLARFDRLIAGLSDERKIALVDRLEKIVASYREAGELLPRVTKESAGD